MTHHEECKLRILHHASTTPLNNVTARGLANKYGMPESYLRQELVRMADTGLIRLSAWDGERDRRCDEWPDPDSFFFNSTRHRQLRIRLLVAGAELLTGAFPQPRTKAPFRS